MVRVKEDDHILDDGSIDLDAWLAHLADKPMYKDNRLIYNACILSQLAGQDHATESGESCLQQGLAIAEILADLDLDPEALAAAIISESYLYADINIDDVNDQLGEDVAKLVAGMERMAAIDTLRRGASRYSRQQTDNIRKMLIAMVDDVRVVLIKLAERLRLLRTASHLSESTQRYIAQEAMDIYAPLANRLGIGQIKWEMEDLSFRYLEPQRYKEIAIGLNARRVDRDKYVKDIVAALENECAKAGIKNFEVYGRSKHIHSIHRKMARKNVDISQIFDATAVRVLVPSVDDCYKVLGIVDNEWQSIPEEFDDYINNPKPNGYRSLHTAVIGPQDRVFEVQIRTHKMHSEAELGVAAHWRYKEGGTTVKESHERKIEWLREVLAWQKELALDGEQREDVDNPYLDDRVYIFTPGGDVLDLPQGATPLDFAYTIHTDVGHRCKGAKINGHIVQLSYHLRTGDQVEILTAKQPNPSRDWINPHLGYLKTSRAKAKVLHWFKQLDYDENLAAGKDLIEKELKKLSIHDINYKKLAESFNFKKSDDLIAAIGRGDIRLNQVINRMNVETAEKISKPIPIVDRKPEPRPTDIDIQGVGNLMTHMAKCCKPLPGDPIIGYITQGQGISIHHKDCANVLYALENNNDRLIDVNWGTKLTQNYPADLLVKAYDRYDLIHDITALLSNEKSNLLALNTHVNKDEQLRYVALSVEIENMSALSRLIDKMQQIPNVIEVKRVSQS